jgi:uncharacterized membrane protein
MPGDWRIGGAVALVEPCVNTMAFYLYECGRAHWQRLRQGEILPRPTGGRWLARKFERRSRRHPMRSHRLLPRPYLRIPSMPISRSTVLEAGPRS